MPTFTVDLSDDLTQWLRDRAQQSGMSPEALLAVIVEDVAGQSEELAWQERDVLRSFREFRARPAVPVPVQSLWHSWSKIAPGASNQDFVTGLERLVERGFVDAPQGEESTQVSLTEAGFAAAADA